MAGRPRVEVDEEALKQCIEAGYSKKEICIGIGISRPTLERCIDDSTSNLQHCVRFSTLTDDEIDRVLLEAKLNLPHMGERFIIGYFKSKGFKIQRRRLRQAIRRVDPDGLAQRRAQLGRRITRRIYTNPHPHFLWHIDTNHKLIRWKIVIHAAIDGFSRSIIYLRSYNNNRPKTVIDLFTKAVSDIGICPRKVRTDLGIENIYLHELLGPDAMAGSSVHNQRVERLNRDINQNIRERFGVVFYELENAGNLDVSELLDIAVLHYVFIPRINKSLDALQATYNNHPLSTENNLSPKQLVARYIHDFPVSQRQPLPANIISNLHTSASADSESDILLENVTEALHTAGYDPLGNDGEEGMSVFTTAKNYLKQSLQLYN